MMTTKSSIRAAAVCISMLAALGVPATGRQSVDYGKVLGVWNMEVNADGQYYYFKLAIESAEGKLSGKVSENSGMFVDLPVAAVDFDGQNLKFEITAPTPPDGSEKVWKGDLKVDTDTLEGTVSNNEIGSLPVTGKRQPRGQTCTFDN